MAASCLGFLFILGFSALIWSVSALDDNATDEIWENYKVKFDKKYEDDEDEQKGREEFEKNMLHVSVFNMLDKGGYSKSLNPFSDMDPDEVIKTMCKTSVTKDDPEKIVDFSGPVRTPSVNWTQEGMVTPVRDQGNCGSCWGFGTVQAVESQCAMLNGELQMGSVQQLIDCSKPYNNRGCSGGFPAKAFMYMARSGLVTEDLLPYKGLDTLCFMNSNETLRDAPKINVTDYVIVGPANDENAVANAVATQGPVTVSINTINSFVQYKGGIYNDPACTAKKVNHAVLLTGYGTDENGKDYWIIKNSWGTKWGMNGYMLMARNANNMCGIASHVSYPVVSDCGPVKEQS